jgi:hypothetical protein
MDTLHGKLLFSAMNALDARFPRVFASAVPAGNPRAIRDLSGKSMVRPSRPPAACGECCKAATGMGGYRTDKGDDRLIGSCHLRQGMLPSRFTQHNPKE